MKASVMKAVAASRTTGTLALSGQELEALPVEAFDPDLPLPDGSVNWWEVCELTKLVASHNKLKELPPDVSQLTTLTSIDLGHNELQALPGSLAELQVLKVLDITGNRFSSLPPLVGQLPGLVRLLCGSNGLTSLPPLGAGQPDLAEINACSNAISSLPEGLSSSASLIRLNLQANKVCSLPGAVLCGLPSLTDLNLRQNSLRGALDPGVGHLTALKLLDLRENAITELPAAIGQCTALVELHAGFNALTTLPAELATCGNLSVLDVRKNKLSSLPPGLCKLRLSLLDLTDNDMSSLPPELGLMTTLRKLPLAGNPLRAMRHEILTGPTHQLLQWLRDKLPDRHGPVGQQDSSSAHTSNLFGQEVDSWAADMAAKLSVSGNHTRELNFPGAKLTAVPPEVWEAGRAGLVKLNLSGNQITALPPEELSACRELAVLDLTNNRLQSWPLPAARGALPGLQQLLMARNPITRAPPSPLACCHMTLRTLDVSGVPAAAAMAPGWLTNLPALEELLICMVPLTAFPHEIVEEPLDSLRVLKLSSTHLQELPQAVTRLTRLEELDVSNNDLCSIPPEIGLMTTLRSLQVDGNRLRTIRRPVLERGTKSLLEYLRDRIPS